MSTEFLICTHEKLGSALVPLIVREERYRRRELHCNNVRLMNYRKMSEPLHPSLYNGREGKSSIMTLVCEKVVVITSEPDSQSDVQSKFSFDVEDPLIWV